MPPRLHKTLVDYLVIAISPALIMTLVGSLALFLIEVFYRGNFQGRLEYIFSLFVMGAVLIARISIEAGRERAMLFALPLGIVTLVAINRFVQFQGDILAPVSFLINFGLLGVVWWSADRLTWDCTLIDESEEDSGEGLLESVGLDRPSKAALQEAVGQAVPDAGSSHLRHSLTYAEPEATTSREDRPLGWWGRFVERRRRPHAPGVWVVYFSLAAVALFGLGQLFIPGGDLAARQYAFQLLLVYTASGLGLLLSTSFLGLRRYLRQRQQEMPLSMVNLWLGIGAVLIVAVMLSALLVPRPNAEYAVSKLPFRIGSPDQKLKPSPYAAGRDGVKEKQPWARGTPTSDQSSDSAKPDEQRPASSSEKQQPSSDRQSTSTDPQAQSADGQAAAKQGETSDRKQSGTRGQAGRESREKGRASAKRDTPKNAEQSPASRDSEQETTSRSAPGQAPNNDANVRRSGGRQGATPAQPLHAFQPVKVPIDASELLLSMLKWFFYGVLAVGVLYWAWHSRSAILAALSNAIQGLLDFWHGLFGGTRRPADQTADGAGAPAAPPRHFADFTDPFASGAVGHYAPEQLVRYTFEALEAWAADRGFPRGAEQTPHEFTRSVAARVSSLAEDAPRLADLYCRVAYAASTLPPKSVTRLERLWQSLKNLPSPLV